MAHLAIRDWRHPVVAGDSRTKSRVARPATEAARARLGPTMLLLGAVLAVIVPAIVVEERVFVLKLVVAAILSILPGWIYLVFIRQRGRSLYDEYVLNLFRLNIDEPGNLPMPPQHTSHYARWRTAHNRVLEEARRADEAGAPAAAASERVKNSEKRNTDNLYRKKFENVYGAGAVSTFHAIHGTKPSLRDQTETFSPVLMATFLISLGWTFIMSPELARVLFRLGLGGTVVAPKIPEALLFGFLGAYAFVLQDLVRRYFREDLRAGAYISASARIVFVALVVFVGHLMWSDTLAEQEGLFAFLVGFFPLVGLQAIQAAISKPLGRLMPSLSIEYPLSRLQGLNFWYEARLTEEGVDDMQNLVSANLVDLMLNTRVPVQRIVDWLDQACLHLHLPAGAQPGKGKRSDENSPVTRLRALGIRTATDLEDSWNALGQNRGFLRQFNEAIGVDPRTGSAAIESIILSFKGETALGHVRSFRKNAWLAEPGPSPA